MRSTWPHWEKEQISMSRDLHVPPGSWHGAQIYTESKWCALMTNSGARPPLRHWFGDLSEPCGICLWGTSSPSAWCQASAFPSLYVRFLRKCQCLEQGVFHCFNSLTAEGRDGHHATAYKGEVGIQCEGVSLLLSPRGPQGLK